ncbi:MAG: carboxypeptidase-like regulatory domain-containing protein, partial [Tannerellaceae bacterium]|nr:carboxypeptidase-like regulatory domain-containing protein [Tannerellaceae bacterium]
MRRRIIIIFLNVFFVALLHGQSFQQIRGIVRDKSSNAPLEYATVVVQSNPPQGSVTDSLGRFSIKHVPIGRYDIQASFMGYEPVIIKEILLSAAKEVFLEIQMTENVYALGEVTVTPRVNK